MSDVTRRIRWRKHLQGWGTGIVLTAGAMNFSSWAWDIDFGFTGLILVIIGTTAVLTGTYIGRGLPARPVTTEQPQTPSPSPHQDPPAPR